MYVTEKDFVWNPAKCICENGKYLASIMDDYLWWSCKVMMKK